MLYALHVRVIEATDIPRMDANATDAYCVVQTSSESQNTFVVQNNMHPRWNQEFHFNVSAPTVGSLRITMHDRDAFKDDNISYIDIQFCSLPLGQVIDQWYNMIPFNRVHKGGRLHLVLHMTPANAPPFVPGYVQPGYAAAPAPAYPAGYAAPPPAYPAGYAAPPPAYGAPPPAYGAPPPAYGAPPPAYGAPPPAYPPPRYGYPGGYPPRY